MNVDPITQDSFQKLVTSWEDAVSLEGENLLQIWSPISGAHRRVRQFVESNYSARDPSRLHVIVDANQNENVKISEIENEISIQLSGAMRGGEGLDKWFETHRNTKVVLFLLGFDMAMKNHSFEAIHLIGTMCEKFSMLSTILFTELNVFELGIYQKLTAKSAFLQNVKYVPLYSSDDTYQFLSYLENKWDFKIPPPISDQIIEKIGGHFLLVKEVARQLKQNAKTNPEKILETPSFLRKVYAILDALCDPDKKIVMDALQGGRPTQISEYLMNIGFVGSSGQLTFPVLVSMRDMILRRYQETQETPNFDSLLTSTERDLWEMIVDRKKGIISRDDVARTMWGKNWEEYYSDWAIDQAIHRLREKLTASHSPLAIRTKKGAGFILTNTIVNK